MLVFDMDFHIIFSASNKVTKIAPILPIVRSSVQALTNKVFQ